MLPAGEGQSGVSWSGRRPAGKEMTLDDDDDSSLWACGVTQCRESRPSDSFFSRSEGLDHAEGASTGFMDASGRVLSEGYGHDGPGVFCLGDGQTEAEGVPSQGGRGDALLRCMSPHLT